MSEEATNPLRQDSFSKPLRYRDCAILFRAIRMCLTGNVTWRGTAYKEAAPPR